ncbi:MAG: AtpZ/AtpI family protein [Jatrophihabitantaceae bacterium]
MARDAPTWSSLLGMGAVAAVTLVLGLALGWLIDSLSHTTPIFLFAGLLLGIAAAVSYTYLEFRKYLKD